MTDDPYCAECHDTGWLTDNVADTDATPVLVGVKCECHQAPPPGPEPWSLPTRFLPTCAECCGTGRGWPDDHPCPACAGVGQVDSRAGF
jgi:hypothetical protein